MRGLGEDALFGRLGRLRELPNSGLRHIELRKQRLAFAELVAWGKFGGEQVNKGGAFGIDTELR